MTQLILFFLIVFALFACKKEVNLEPCDLPALSGTIFVGGVSLCNAQAGFQRDFETSLLITLVDSIFHINIQSLDSTVQWSYFDSARIECIYPENDLSYALFTLGDGTETGYLLHGTDLFYRIKNDPCIASSFGGSVK